MSESNTVGRDGGGALAGVRVLDFGHVLAAPLGAQTLADFGADVIKIEHPVRGDMSRAIGRRLQAGDTPAGESSMFACANRNKRSITVDFSKPPGRDLVKALIGKCDVLVESYITGTLEKYGLDYDSVRAVKPDIIYCSLTGFGQTGPKRFRPGVDPVFQALSGLMSVTGPEAGALGEMPMKAGPSIVDVTTGYNLAIGVLAALFHRQRTGEGQHIDVALMDVSIAMQGHVVQEYLNTGEQPPRLGNSGNGFYPAAVFRCADGYLYISCGLDGYDDLCDAIGHPELKADPRFATSPMRFANRKAWNEAVAATLGRWRRDDLEAALSEVNVSVAPVQDYAEAFADPHVVERGVRQLIESREAPGAPLPVVGNPVRMQGTPATYRRGPPRLGEHTDEVLTELLALSPDELRTLRADGAI